MERFMDCFFEMNDDVLSVGNALIERKIRINDRGMQPVSLYDRKRGKRWTRAEEECPLIPAMFPDMHLEISVRVGDHDGLSDEHLEVCLLWKNNRGECQERVFEVYPDIPMIHMRCRVKFDGAWAAHSAAEMEYTGGEADYAAHRERAQADAIDALPFPKGHYDLEEIMLVDRSDQNDTLLKSRMQPVYNHGWGGDEAEGNLFILRDRLDGQGVLLVKEAPTVQSMMSRTKKDLKVVGNKSVQLIGSGMDGQELDGGWAFAYGSTVGVGCAEELYRAFRRLYRAMWHGKDHVRVLSNTWGDRNQDKAVCHDFMMKEIDCAAELGVQVVQIDDGWQKGHTANSALKKNGVWEGYYKQDPDFWQPHAEKFPEGLEPLVSKARENGIELGLWFSPDSSEEFANWRRDVDTLLSFWRDMGIRRFKLDGVNLRSKLGESRYLQLLEVLNKESNGQICVNQDITAAVRLGQIYYREHGNLFVENRYTDFGSYYPHNTLKNLWTLSRFVPAGKMQFECLNRGRNQDKYPAEDPFAPEKYTMDYLFAVTMAASPLIWMEMSHLAREDAEALRKIISVYRKYQAVLTDCDIAPVGEMPDGMSFTGFHAEAGDKSGYLILFREAAEKDTFLYKRVLAGSRVKFELLASNLEDGEFEMQTEEDGMKVRMGAMRSYAFIRYEEE